MKRALLNLLPGAFLMCLTSGVHAQSIELQAITDFSSLGSGEVPYYVDTVGGRNVLAINAANETYRNKFARAEHAFTGPAGIYDITIHALAEIDGEGTYRLLIDGQLQGEAVNKPVELDFSNLAHTFHSIALSTSSVIGVESTAVSNNSIPEGDGYAFARGRWRGVTLVGIDAVPDNLVVDLALSLSTNDSLTQANSSASVFVTVNNKAETTTATNPVIVFSVPDNMQFNGSDACIPNNSEVHCALSELAPQASATATFIVDFGAQGPFDLSAQVSADQVDTDIANNSADLIFEALAPVPVASEPEINPESLPPTGTSTDSDTEASETASESEATVEPVAVTPSTDAINSTPEPIPQPEVEPETISAATTTSDATNPGPEENEQTDNTTLPSTSETANELNSGTATANQDDTVGAVGLPTAITILIFGMFRFRSSWLSSKILRIF